MAFSGSWAEACEYIARVWGTDAASVNNVLSTYDSGLTAAEAVQKWVYDTNVTPAYVNNAKISYYTAANGAKAWQYAEFGGTAAGNSLNSNVVTRTAIRTPVNTSVTTAQGVTKFTAKVGLREAGSFVFGEVVPAIAAAGWGITLGKTIDSALYNANPDFWDAHGMSTLNPETWNSITSGYDGVAGSLFNLIFGLNGDKGQAYLDEDAAIYLAQWLKEQGFFSTGTEIESTGDVVVNQTITQNDIKLMPFAQALQYLNYTGYASDYYVKYAVENYPNKMVALLCRNALAMTGSNIAIMTTGHGDSQRDVDNLLLSDFSLNVSSVSNINVGSLNSNIPFYNDYDSSRKTGRCYFVNADGLLASGSMGNYALNNRATVRSYYNDSEQWGSTISNYPLLVNWKAVGGLPGVGDQAGATLPDTTGWTDPASTKASLQQQYPDLWNNAKHNDYIDDQGNTTTKTYIPVNLPQFLNKNDTQPTSGNRTQTDPEISPNNATKDLLDTVSPIIMPPEPETTPTGTGSTPDIVPPTGNASSLWAVYNPTQAEVDAFGSWLWSSNLVEQIKKLFNDPMQAIIGIHKVFATPSTSGSGTIKCGYIDSGVSSAIVSSQYTDINCGTVDLAEYFGDVFDYSPFTEVSLYLPFIGIVKLDTSDVMRSSINIKYHIDVITGACLADVKVIRDGERSVLYQYAGSCIVTYPLSSGSYASALTGVLSIAGGIVGTVASGGALAPVALGAAVGATKLHSDVQKSGSFTGAAGAMGSKKPYLIISRPQTQLANNFEKYEGKPANHYVKVQNCSGFIKVKEVHVNKTSASETEMEMIKNMLMTGIEV